MDEKEKNLVSIFECRMDKFLDKDSKTQSSLKEQSLPQSLSYEKITKSTAPCIMDLLNLK